MMLLTYLACSILSEFPLLYPSIQNNLENLGHRRSATHPLYCSTDTKALHVHPNELSYFDLK